MILLILGEIDWSNAHSAIEMIKNKIKRYPDLRPYVPPSVSYRDLISYSLRCLFFFSVGFKYIRIKMFGLWLLHI